MTDIVQRLRLVDPNQMLLAPPPRDTSYLQAGLICREAAAEIERLRNTLHRISLASQNSMSSKGECGRIARAALEGKP